MHTDNPYLAPTAESASIDSQNEELSHLDFDKVKKLYHRSTNVTAITALLTLGLIALVSIIMLSPGPYEIVGRSTLIGIAIFYALTIVGLYKRTSWGRILGIITSLLSLLNVPIGTIIGLAGLFAFIKSPELFGANRLTHKKLKKEFKLRKKNKKLAKQNQKLAKKSQ